MLRILPVLPFGLLLLAGPLSGCKVEVSDDDSSADDDSAGDDDSSADDDSAGDDDSVTPACPPGVEEGMEELLASPNIAVCGSVSFGVSNPAQTFDLALQWDVPKEFVAGDSFTLDAASPLLNLRVETGKNLLHYDCNDALWLEEVIALSLEPVSGTFVFTIDSVDPSGTEAHATLGWSGLTVEDPTDPSVPASGCSLPDAMFSDLYVGWLPG